MPSAAPTVPGHTGVVRRRADAVALAAGAAVLGAAMLLVRSGRVPAVEEAVFRAVNDLPDAVYRAGWVFMQAGNLVMGIVVAVVAVALRRWRLAVAALAVTALKLVTERAVKAVVVRRRPWTSIGPDVVLRGDVPRTSPSFVSGHALLLGGLAVVVAPYLTGRWRWVPWILVALNAAMRVQVGAHNPLDVVGGTALGIALGAAVNLALGVPARTPEAPGSPR